MMNVTVIHMDIQ